MGEFVTPLRSLHVKDGSMVEVDGRTVYNVTKLTLDASKDYVEATVSFLPANVAVEVPGARLVCENCGAGLKLTDWPEERDTVERMVERLAP